MVIQIGGFFMPNSFTKTKQSHSQQTDKSRENCYLPNMSFITEDQWEDVIGEKGFRAWRKFYIMCDRSKTEENIRYYCKYFNAESIDEINFWEQAVIKCSISHLHERLKDTLKCSSLSRFYKEIIKPLWNVGLIDIIEWEESRRKGQLPKNIIVYAYPQNDKSLANKPLEKVRDYDTDYNSTSRNYGLIGAEKQRKSKKVQSRKKSEAELYMEYMDSLTPVEECPESYPQNPVDNEHVDIVEELNGMDLPQEEVEENPTVTSDREGLSKMTGIKNSTPTNKNTNNNTITNTNNHYHSKQYNYNKGEKLEIKFDVDENEKQLINQSKIFHYLFERLKDHGVYPENHMPIAYGLWNLGIKTFDPYEVKETIKRVVVQKKKGKTFSDIRKYIVTAIYNTVTNSVLPTATAIQNKDRERKKWESPVGQAISASSGSNSYPFYDWLHFSK